MTMYARSTLTSWNASSGAGDWSNTSGGASNASWPSSLDDVVFDSNSGSARTITVGTSVPCKSINTTGSAGMTFVSGDLNVYGSVTLINTISVVYIQLQTPAPPATRTITCGGASIGTFYSSDSNLITLGSDLLITTDCIIAGDFDANNFNVTTPSFTNVTGSPTTTMGSGTWTLTGIGSIWSVVGTLVPGTSTIKVTNNSASLKNFFSNGKTYNNFWNATLGGGDMVVREGGSGGNGTYNNFKVSAGAIQKFGNGQTCTAASFSIDGTGAPITISSNSPGVASTLAKSGGGTVNVDYCNIKDIIASPAATFRARNSLDQGNNTNWTFVPANSKFMSFF